MYILCYNENGDNSMYEEIELDGKIIKIRREIPEEETGIVVENDELEKTIDFSEKLGEINDEQ